jgi:hypothetical protein
MRAKYLNKENNMTNTFAGLPYKEGFARAAFFNREPEYREMTPMYERMAEAEREYVKNLTEMNALPWESWKEQWESKIRNGELRPHTL